MDPAEIVDAARLAVRADRLDDALTLLQALSHLPSPRLWLMRADLHRERCEPRQAIAALDRAVALGAGDSARIRAALMWSPILGDPTELDEEWARNEQALRALDGRALAVTDPVGALPWLDFYLAYRGRDDAGLRTILGRVLSQATPGLTWTAPHVSEGPTRQGPVRLGFCSAHLKDHTIGRLNEALVCGLSDHHFHVVMAVPDAPADPLGRAMAAAADEVIVLGRDLDAARGRLAQARLDVLHYPDLGMDPFTTWLSFARLAPVQTASWGHPITSGLPSIDAFLASDRLVPRGGSERFTEEIVRLPDPMVCWTPPEAPPAMDRAALGLPDDKHIYLVPQSAFKLHPDFDVALRRIAEADPDGVIALLAPSRPSWQPRLDARMGLPQAQRVWVPRQPREGYLALLQAADVVLDPFPFGGGHTSLEALAMGSPIATLATTQLRGRLTACWYDVMELGSLVALDVEDYVAKAVLWATDPHARRRVTQAIRMRSERLFSREDAVASHAAAFHQLVARSHAQHQRGRLRRVG